MNADLHEQLLTLDSCAVSDALDSAGLPPAVTGLSPLSVRRRIAGPCITVRLGPRPGKERSVRHLCTRAIEAAAGGEVIVIENSGIECAGWGGVLSAGARCRNVAGVVIDGLARDIDEAIALEFPIFGRGATARTARDRVWEIATNERISIGPITVEPGDWVIADSSGVAFIPSAHALDVVRRARDISRREQLMVEALRAGGQITEVLGADYEDMLRKLD